MAPALNTSSSLTWIGTIRRPVSTRGSWRHFFGRFYGECLEAGEIGLEYGPDGFKVTYYNIAFPLRVESYLNFFQDLSPLRKKLPDDHPDIHQASGHPLRLEGAHFER